MFTILMQACSLCLILSAILLEIFPVKSVECLPCNLDRGGLTGKFQRKDLSIHHGENICQLSKDFTNTKKNPMKSNRVQKAEMFWLKKLNHWKKDYIKDCQFKDIRVILKLLLDRKLQIIFEFLWHDSIFQFL